MKKRNILFWSATIIILLFEAAMPLGTLLLAPQYATAGTKPLGYPDYFAYALIVCKVLGALAIALPFVPSKMKEWAYAGLTFNLFFAALSHVMVDGIIWNIMMPIVIGVILALSYYFNPGLNRQVNFAAI